MPRKQKAEDLQIHPVFQTVLRRDTEGNYLCLCPVVDVWCAMDEEAYTPKRMRTGLGFIIRTGLAEFAWRARN